MRRTSVLDKNLAAMFGAGYFPVAAIENGASPSRTASWTREPIHRTNPQFGTNVQALGYTLKENILAFEDNPGVFKTDHFQSVSGRYSAARK